MKFPEKNNCRFCLVGSGKVLALFAKLLINNHYSKPIIITWNKKRHERDLVLLKNNKNFINIFEFAEKNKIELIEVNNISDNEIINNLKKRDINIIFSVSSRWIFKKKFIDSFNGLVLNVHAGYLPQERGSQVYPKILNNVKKAGATIHIVEPEVDAGPILLKKQIDFDIPAPSINQLTEINNQISVELIELFLERLSKGQKISQEYQDLDQGIYMPQLYTEINGFINWDWEARHIDSFIRAFGVPMPGAATYYKGEVIKIMESYIENSEIEIHPLFHGRIINVTKEGYAKIATKKDILVLTKIKKEIEILPSKLLNVSNILYTPYKVLENAKVQSIRSLDMKKP